MHPVRIIGLFFLIAVLGGAVALAADPPADTWNILRDKLKADKKLVVAENLELTQKEADAFWPVVRRLPGGPRPGSTSGSGKPCSCTPTPGTTPTSPMRQPGTGWWRRSLAIDEAELQLKKALAAEGAEGAAAPEGHALSADREQGPHHRPV